ncbi:hypothetical protein J2D73_19540 [Acetobacter sacchari]|uniref:Uncharacterized protein n=1 Tax=Acetobacter sacchari TaxID=2661687 RepID=A0ABS3M1F5_9PROT|nr:hypothetical protein [Acetobacter sacchari]MBO1361979.1 hypothetical protein [Acetobacter sacchari]
MSAAATIQTPSDLGLLFPIKTHALNTSDHDLIRKAQEVTEREVWARKITDESADGNVPAEAEAAFTTNGDALQEMARVEVTTWDGWIARQIAFATFQYSGPDRVKMPDCGPDEWLEYAAGHDAIRHLENKTTHDRPKEYVGAAGKALSALLTSSRVLYTRTDGRLTLLHCLIERIKSRPGAEVDKGWLLPALEVLLSEICDTSEWFRDRLDEAEFSA